MAAVKVTMRVPRNAVGGERYGAAWAQVASKGKGTIKTVHRVGVCVYLSVGPGGEPPSDFTIDKITPGRTDKGLPPDQGAGPQHRTPGFGYERLPDDE